MAQTRTENTIDVDALPDDIGVPPSSRYLFSERKGKGDLSNLIHPRNELPKLPSGNHFSSTSSSSSSSSSSSTTVTPKPISPLPSSKEPGQPLSTYNCPICFSPPTYATLTPCGHVLCGECLFTAVKAGIQRGALHGPASEMAKCPVCRAIIPGWDGKGGGVIGLKPRVKVETVEYD
ncbi:hypothetical protein C8Q75DRAFT_715583 [Abortiporus biennis]|nr:hypothetical protein C8Q75DRAFT_715583 [Abortiporus biennis]